MNSIKLFEWFFVNKVFCLTYFFCSILLSYYTNNSFKSIICILTMIIAPLHGYLIHVISHKYNFNDIFYKKYHQHLDPLTKNVLFGIVSYFDFHDKVHHSDNSKKIFYILIEAFQNFQTQTLNLLLFNFLIFNNVLDNSIILLWGLTYVTLHLINFNIYESKNHIRHHENPKINYELYIFDIIFGTVEENATIEGMNLISINVVIIALLILIIYKKTVFYIK